MSIRDVRLLLQDALADLDDIQEGFERERREAIKRESDLVTERNKLLQQVLDLTRAAAEQDGPRRE